MRVLIKNATIIDANSEFHLKKKDILVDDGIIKSIKDSINDEVEQIIEDEDLHVSIGWIDLKAHFREPGHEYKEDIQSGLNAAEKGGFTKIVMYPGTTPPIDNSSLLQFVKAKASNHIVDLLPAGCISVDRKHENLAELYDMHQNGAVIFSDDDSIENTSLMEKALLYSKNFDGIISTRPEEKALTKGAQMHEGMVSTTLGLKGKASISETIRIKRDISLAEYTGGNLHFSSISTKEGVELIKEAKQNGLNISAEVSANQLYFTDKDLNSFDTLHKVNPPYREESDKKALIEGLKDGTIDVISSDHRPEDIENKKVEFDYAAEGIINLQTAYAIANTSLNQKLSLLEIIEKFTTNPRKLLRIKNNTIKEDNSACLTIFSPSKKWIFDKNDVLSKSKNSPFFGKELIGKPLAIINNNKVGIL